MPGWWWYWFKGTSVHLCSSLINTFHMTVTQSSRYGSWASVIVHNQILATSPWHVVSPRWSGLSISEIVDLGFLHTVISRPCDGFWWTWVQQNQTVGEFRWTRAHCSLRSLDLADESGASCGFWLRWHSHLMVGRVVHSGISIFIIIIIVYAYHTCKAWLIRLT